MPGYPEEIEVECDFPPGYHSNNWVYDLWKSGVWTNFGNITRCIDPNQCYTAPPILPTDFSVEYNYTLESSNTVNTTLQYSCTKESKFSLAHFNLAN